MSRRGDKVVGSGWEGQDIDIDILLLILILMLIFCYRYRFDWGGRGTTWSVQAASGRKVTFIFCYWCWHFAVDILLLELIFMIIPARGSRVVTLIFCIWYWSWSWYFAVGFDHTCEGQEEGAEVKLPKVFQSVVGLFTCRDCHCMGMVGVWPNMVSCSGRRNMVSCSGYSPSTMQINMQRQITTAGPEKQVKTFESSCIKKRIVYPAARYGSLNQVPGGCDRGG